MEERQDMINRQAAIDALDKRFDNVPMEQTAEILKLRKDLRELSSIQPEPCEDAVSRRGLLSDLKELTAAWKKYPVMAEQIKGVEAAIGYVETIPPVTPKQRWISVSERLPEEPFGCLVTVWDTNPVTMDEFENLLPYFVGWDGEQWNDADGEQCPFEVIAWCELPEPYRGEEK